MKYLTILLAIIFLFLAAKINNSSVMHGDAYTVMCIGMFIVMLLTTVVLAVRDENEKQSEKDWDEYSKRKETIINNLGDL